MFKLTPFSKCFSPVRIYNRFTHTYEYVSCGKCPGCQNTISLLKSQQVQKEIELTHAKGGFNLFFTLTYDNESLPMVRPFYDDNGILRLRPVGRTAGFDSLYWKSFPFTPFVFTASGKHPEFEFQYPCYSHDTGELLKTLNLQQYPVKVFPKIEKVSPEYEDCFGVLCKQDLKHFFMRLRKLINKVFKDEKEKPTFRYSACGEYGSVTKRPHYHVVLHYTSRLLDKQIFSLIKQAWAKRKRITGGRNRYTAVPLCAATRWTHEFQKVRKPNVSYIRPGNTKTSGYVAKYITGYSDLPAILQLKEFKPFFLSSKKPSLGVRKSIKKEIFNHFRYEYEHSGSHANRVYSPICHAVTKFDKTSGVTSVDYIPYPAYALRTVIGKPFEYRLLSASRKHAIVAFATRCASLLKKCQHFSAQKRIKWLNHHADSYCVHEYLRLEMFRPQNWNYVVTAIRISELCQVSIPFYFKVNDYYWHEYELYKLRKMYELQETYMQQFHDTKMLLSCYPFVLEYLPDSLDNRIYSGCHLKREMPDVFWSPEINMLNSLGFKPLDFYPDTVHLNREYVQSLRDEFSRVSEDWRNKQREIYWSSVKTKKQNNTADKDGFRTID